VIGGAAHSRASLVALVAFSACACSSFDPVEVPRFELVGQGDNERLEITGAQWVAYDDQHSLTSACTNGAAGNHDPDKCSLLYDPPFDWDEPKCVKGAAQLEDGKLKDPGKNICIQGVLRPYEGCQSSAQQCLETTIAVGSTNTKEQVDASNMWGAGFGLAFTSHGKGWNAKAHGVVGVAFDLSGMEEAKLGPKALNVRVEVPIVLAPETKLPQQPVMRDDGKVIGISDGNLYHYDCDSMNVVTERLPEEQRTGTLNDVLSEKGGSRLLTSELHPLGSPFWQEGTVSNWVPSPVHVGHNEFKLTSVLPPKDSEYVFDEDAEIVGIHFQVVHGDPSNKEDLPFSFCIANLAFLLK